MKKIITTLLSIVSMANASTIIWNAEEANVYDFYDTPNWDFSESDLQELDRDAPIPVDLVITTTYVFEDSPSYSNIELEDNITLTLVSSTFIFENANGFAGVNDDNDTYSTVNLTQESVMNAMFSTVGLQINVDSTSSLTLRGSGDAINSQTERSIVNLAPNAKLTLDSIEEFAEQGNDILVNGVSFSEDSSILIFNGTSATAIPETNSVLLGSMGVLLLLGIRKRIK